MRKSGSVPLPEHLLAEGHEALLNDVPLGFGERAPPREPVDGVQHGVDHNGPVVRGAGKQGCAFGDEGQHS